MADSPPTVQLGKHGREPIILFGIGAAFLVGALLKPWAPPPTSRPLVQAPTAQPSHPPASAGTDPLAGLRAECDEPQGWRVYSREPFLRQVVRVWRSVEPAGSASGPLDPAIPVVPVGPRNLALGYCAPWTGPERPPDGSDLTVWRENAAGAGSPRGSGGTGGTGGTAGHAADGSDEAAAVTATPITIERLVPASPSMLGGLYLDAGGDPPGSASGVGGWPAGQYVFAIRAPGWQRWWSVDVSGPHARTADGQPAVATPSPSTP